MVYVGFGGNEENTLEVFASLRTDFVRRFRTVRFSSLYKSLPLMDIEQEPFWNAVAEFDFDREPLELLDLLQDWEREYGRVRNPLRPKGPRVVDLDLLLWGDRIVRHPRLSIPHDRMHEREFVLKPLLELQPSIDDPRTHIPFAVVAKGLMNQGVYLQSDSW